MTNTEITALACEYADETPKIAELKVPYIREYEKTCEDFLRFLLRRYCLVEKSKLKTKHREALAALESNDNEDVKWGTYRLSLLKSLFPEIAKEAEP